MRRSLLALAFAALGVPMILSAQPPEHDSHAPSRQVAPVAPPAPPDDTRSANAPRSLMGAVMAVLIESAEQQAAANGNRANPPPDRDTARQAIALDSSMQASGTQEQVAVQSEP